MLNPSPPRCLRCGRPLIGKRSLQLGYGRRCFRKQFPNKAKRKAYMKIRAHYDWRQMMLPFETRMEADE